MTAILMHVPTERVREYWPQIRARVEELSQLPGEPWIAEDVYHELLLGGTHLFTTLDVRGFIVTQIRSNPYSRQMHVWLASNEGSDWTPEFFEQLKDIARANDCGSITFVSDRTGWKRALPGIRAQTLYSFDLGDENG
jgi:hypothetical protein